MSITANVVLENPKGLHARPSALLAKSAQTWASRISVSFGARTINAKSLIEILTLGAKCGSVLTVTVCGPDEVDAMAAVCEALKVRFY